MATRSLRVNNNVLDLYQLGIRPLVNMGLCLSIRRLTMIVDARPPAPDPLDEIQLCYSPALRLENTPSV